MKDISKLNFRDLNKIAHVFEVNWLIEKCLEYFQELAESVREDNYDEQSFLFDEAMFILDKLKKRTFINVVIKKFTSTATYTQNFVTKYLRDFSSCSSKNLDVIMELTADQENVLLEALINNLERTECTLDQTSRYILQRLTYKDCSSTYETVYQRLFEKLAELVNPTTEDFRLIMRALQQYNTVQKKLKNSISYTVLPNLFLDFQQLNNINDLDELTTFLIESPMVRNSYIFFDALCNWHFEKRIDIKTPFVSISDKCIEKFAQTMEIRGWKPLELEYVRRKNGLYLGGLVDKIRNKASMVSKNCSNRIPSKYEYSSEELFARDHDIKFKFKQASITNCSKEGDCGFILRVTAATGKIDDSFDIQLVIDPNLYPDDIHYHRESHMLADNIHFTLDITLVGKTHPSAPITWHGRPCQDITDKYWHWGAHGFWKREDTTASKSRGDISKWASCYSSTAKIRPVVFIV